VIDDYVGQPELAAARNALPWRDLAAFWRRAIGNAIADHAARPLAIAGSSSTAARSMRQRSHRATKLTAGEAGGIKRASHQVTICRKVICAHGAVPRPHLPMTDCQPRALSEQPF
jgi:hypothetical protein